MLSHATLYITTLEEEENLEDSQGPACSSVVECWANLPGALGLEGRGRTKETKEEGKERGGGGRGGRGRGR